MPAVVRLPAGGKALTVRAAADVFLDSLDNANTLRSYGIGVGKTAGHLGEARPLATVADDEIGGALEQLWGEAAVNTWNARRAAVLSWLGWCAERGYDGPKVPAWVKRMPPPDSETPARSKMAVDRLIARRDVHLREKTLWRMLYETVARSEEILGVNIEELDLAGRRAPVKAKGAKPRTRRRGVTREDYVLEPVYWDAGTARLLPRLIKGRTRVPVFVTHRKPGPGKVIAPRDVCPDTGLVRLSYGQARALLDAHTAIGGVPGTGWVQRRCRCTRRCP
ncbi:site-specific integrase [Streptomyces afghaniensis]|uniref:site-specific integrase n=1 Tax=Streptomyces afghaniensis TaxID=66865 RepID=UPI00277EC9DC|nr:site-specific integrase [Streptomyces afghaniensis]MDQ1014303.1 integrase [Streptomyces afghaniensis]